MITDKPLSSIFVFIFLCLTHFSQGQELWSFTIADSLKENANAIVRDHSIQIQINSIKEMEITEKKIITVYNRKADYLLGYAKAYDDATKISELSGKVYGQLGNEIKKIKKKEFEDYNVGGAGVSITDTRVLAYNYEPSSYPITVVYESKVVSKNTGFIPGWSPLQGYNISTERSAYEVKNLSGIPLQSHFDKGYLNLPISIEKRKDDVKAVIENVKARSHESYCPTFSSLAPSLDVALDAFSLHGVEGVGGDWSSFGKWYHDELLNHDLELESSVIDEVKGLVAGINDPKEKARKIYEYVQNRTRYISIQLGIGGWKPFPAQEVHDLAYGDCKGLTHYMRALLKAVDVDAYIAVVYGGRSKKNISKDFTRMQGNHVIVCIPQATDTTWVECTSQSSPFGYLGQFTDDRDVLLVKPEGGEIVHTKDYTAKDNIRSHTAEVHIDNLGALTGHVDIKSEGNMYERSNLYLYKDDEDQEEYFLNHWSNLNRLSIESLSNEVNKTDAELKESLEVVVPEYAYIQGSDIIFKVNPFNTLDNVIPRVKNRNLPFEVRDGKTYHDTYLIHVPNGYRIKNIPEDIDISTSTGSYKSSIAKEDESTLRYTRELTLIEGTFPPDVYGKHRSFLKKVKKHDNIKLSISNKS